MSLLVSMVLSSLGGGPLFVLQWKGRLCPCLESTDERQARQALTLLQGLTIDWIQTKHDSSTIPGSSLMSKLFHTNPIKTVRATLYFCDTTTTDNNINHGLPVLTVEPTPDENNNTESNTTKNTGPLKQQSVGYIKTIPLSQVHTVKLHTSTTPDKDSTISLETTTTTSMSGGTTTTARSSGNSKSLLQFSCPSRNDIQEIQQALQYIISWERTCIPEEERLLEDHHDTRNRAQRAAHFVERELELSRAKRDRDVRKSKYMSMTKQGGGGGGGLKYTALAMANRVDHNNETNNTNTRSIV